MNELVNEQIARKVLETVDAGLVPGLGEQVPGRMCVEAAVNHAYGQPHSDNPPGVGLVVRAFKIMLNDSRWSSAQARARGMRNLAVAQLGSDQIDQHAFAQMVAEGCIRHVLPIALRATGQLNPKFSDALEAASVRCEAEGTAESANAGGVVARKARTGAARPPAVVVATLCADAATAVSHTAADAGAALRAAADAAAAADVAAATAAAAAADADAASDHVLDAISDVGLQALIALRSPGCAYLHLTEPQT